jgi:phosphatidylinositol alpha 1,6-mannosyltransferase
MNQNNPAVKKIMIITETFLPKIDGISNTLVHLLDYLDRHGFSCQMLAPEGGPDLVRRTRILPFKSHPFPFYPELKLVSPFTDTLPYIKKYRPDIIHVVNPVGFGLTGIRQATQLRIPVIASYHTDVPGFAEKWGFGLFQDALWRYFKWVHNQADRTLVPSRYTMKQLEAHGYRRLGIWSRGVDTQQFSPEKKEAHMRIRLTAGNPDQPLLLFVGRLACEKRVDWLLPVLHANPGVRLAIVGDGPARPELENLFRNEPVVFTGYLKGNELANTYASADWFVFPGANETFGNVILEALASGLPVIAADAGGQTDHIQHGKNGLFFRSDQVDSLVNTVTKAITEPGMQEYMSTCARIGSREKSWDSVLSGLIRNYEDTVLAYPKVKAKTGSPDLFKVFNT